MRLRQTVSSLDNVCEFDLTDRGLLLADGVFDTSRIVRGKMVLRSEHLSRLSGDAAALGITAAGMEIEALIDEAVPREGYGALRITVTRGPGGRGLTSGSDDQATLMARFTPMELPYPAPPTRVAISDIRRNPTSPGARHKTLAYTDNVMALRAAVAAGYDEALMLSPENNVACASAANLFARFGSQLVTPRVGDGAMPGVIRGWLIGAAAKAGFEVVEDNLTIARLGEADGVFLTNSLRMFQPVTEVEGRTFDGELPERLLALGSTLLGRAGDD